MHHFGVGGGDVVAGGGAKVERVKVFCKFSFHHFHV